jgi:RHS repeat-associated protein
MKKTNNFGNALYQNGYSFILKGLLPLIGILLAVLMSFGQGQSPDRGYRAGNSYSISDIENVNLTSGNLMLNIPLASLPGGRGSSPGSYVSLRYDSKLWDTFQEARTDGNGDPEAGGNKYTAYHLRPAGNGVYQDAGWTIDTGGYRLALRSRLDLQEETPCAVLDIGVGQYEYGKNAYRYKLEMRFPDGSVKEFRPRGSGAAYEDSYHDSYFSISPNGTRLNYTYTQIGPNYSCSDSLTQVTTSGMDYYSNDGSGVRLHIPYNDNERWKLSYPDGTLIENLPANTTFLQRLTDHNGNQIVWKSGTLNGMSGTMIENDVEQFIFVAAEQNEETLVIQPGVSGELLQTTVHWKDIIAYRKYQTTTAANANWHYLYEEILQSFKVVDTITLPYQAGGLHYSFTYNGADTQPSEEHYTEGFGELKSITLPSGAEADYSYKLDDRQLVPASCGGPTCNSNDGKILENSVTQRNLVYQGQYDGSSLAVSETTLYDIDLDNGIGTVTGPDGGVTTQIGGGLGMSKGYSAKVIHPNGSVTENIWAQNGAPYVTGTFNLETSSAINAYVKTEFTSIPDASGTLSLTAIKDYDYDKNGNLLEAREYDWVSYGSVPRTNGRPSGIPSGAALKRKTVNTYYYPTPIATDTTTSSANHYANPSSPALKKLIKSTEVQNGNGTPFSRAEFYYDNGNASPNKGNLTEVRHWDSSKGVYSSPLVPGIYGNYISTATAYDEYGNIISTSDPKGTITKFIYDDIAGPNGTVPQLYPTQAIAAYGTSVARTSASTYDFYTGLTLTSTDVDNSLTNATEYDPLGRPVKTITAQDTALESWVRTEYHDSDRFVVVRADLETKGDGKKVATKFLDQLGRVRLSKTLEDAATQSATNETDGIKVQTRYRFDNPNSPESSNGTYALISNPYRATTSSTASGEQAMGWSLGYSDKAGKHSEATTFSGTALPAPWGGSTASTGTIKTDTSAERTLFTDQSGKQRISRVNALGQLTDVWEITAQDSATVGVTFPNQSLSHGYQTGYFYDTLGNLLTVDQGSQTRSFSYNSLSRLTSAQNPESGTISYFYNANGNLKQKSQLRSGTANVLTGYDYDDLNRITQRNYSTPNGLPSNYQATPNVTYTYDNKGRLTEVTSSVSTTEYTAFDLLGRVTAHKQTTEGTAYTTGYTYNLSGALIEETYPSGRKVRNTLDASGDLAQVESKKNSTAGYWTYAGNFTFNAAGGVTGMQLGNGHWESTQFNARLQPTQIALGTTPGSTGLLKLNYSYGTTQNNGNVQSQTITMPAVSGSAGFTATQNYSYDQLNRLYDAAEAISGSQTWKQTFSYDRFGNRRFDTQANRTTTLEANCPTTACNPEIDQASNRLMGTTYDSAGNTIVDGGSQQYVYDGENKMVQAKDASGTILGIYIYDGDGKRIKKETASETTIFVYDILGHAVAEYSTQPSQEPQVAYLTGDNLGTPRINTNAGGAVIARHDYHPFGEEISTSQRTNVIGYDTDEIRKKFTGYERDEETDLDFAQARYFQSDFGRFSSPDPLAASASSIEPQSWNRYTYCNNNPVRFTDPGGMVPGDFYNEDEKIGTDGKSDGKIYLVTDKEEVKLIEKTKGAYTGTVASALELTSYEVRQEIGAAVDRSNGPSGSDKKGGDHEEGGIVVATTDGPTAIPAASGGTQGGTAKREIDTTKPADPAKAAEIGKRMTSLELETAYHVHPEKIDPIKDNNKNLNATNAVVFGGSESSSKSHVWEQGPSPKDIKVASERSTRLGYEMVVGARDGKVYFYSGNGVIGTMKLKTFTKAR